MSWSRFAAAAGLLIIAGCQTTEDYVGSGPITLAPNIEQHFQKYLNEENGFAYAVAVDGRSGAGFVYCKENFCDQGTDRRWSAIETCERVSKGVPCKVYAIRKEIVWNQNQPTSSNNGQGTAAVDPPKLSETDLERLPHHTERNWLTLKQLYEFGDYLKVLERGAYPVGAFVVADDGVFNWSTHSTNLPGPIASANKALAKCKSNSAVPETCRLFAANRTILATGQTVSTKDFWSHIPKGGVPIAQQQTTPRLKPDDLPAHVFETKRNWLTKPQLGGFRSYLTALERGDTPVGAFVIAEDGRAVPSVDRPTLAAPVSTANRALQRCRELSTLPETCRIFASNALVWSTGRTVNYENYLSQIPVRPGFTKSNVERDRIFTLRWPALGGDVVVRARPELVDEEWRVSFATPDTGEQCTFVTNYDTDHRGKWSLQCSDGLSATGTGRYFMRDNTSVSGGIGSDGAHVSILSALAPTETS